MISATAVDRLRSIPLFAGIADDHVEQLAERASQQSLEAGEWLFHQGEPGDSLFVVAAGSIDILAEDPLPVVAYTLGRGESVGELSLLTGEPRLLGARARRDSELIRLARDDFDRLLASQPAFAAGLIRLLGGRLRGVRPPEQVAPLPRTIAVVPLHDGAPLASLAERLAVELKTMGPVARLDGGEAPSLESLERLESEHERVLLVTASAAVDDAWTSYCLRQADRVIAVASRRRSPSAALAHERLRGCELTFQAPAGVEPDLDAWMDFLAPRAVQVLRAGRTDGVARLARRLAGRSLGVVLSGGGARGLAHIGVIEELQRSGFVIDRIGGVSMGAMVGSLFAEERSADEVAQILDAEYVRDTPLRGRTIPLVALSRGVHGFAMQHRVHGQRRIEGLDVSFFCVSADLVGQRLVVHRRGLVAVAVSASQALPAFVPPVRDGDRLLVDGAILNNLPVEPMVAMREGPVIAVDVSGGLPPPRPPKSNLPLARRWIVGPAVEWAPSIAETVLRSILLSNVASDATARQLADVVIRPMLRGVPTMRFFDLEAVRRRGRDGARSVIESGALDRLALVRSS